MTDQGYDPNDPQAALARRKATLDQMDPAAAGPSTGTPGAPGAPPAGAIPIGPPGTGSPAPGTDGGLPPSPGTLPVSTNPGAAPAPLGQKPAGVSTTPGLPGAVASGDHEGGNGATDNAPGGAPAATTPGTPGATTNTPGVTADAVQALYQKYLGRSADESGLQGYLNGGHDLGWIENAIKGSSEAQTYSAAHPSSFDAHTDWSQPNNIAAYFQSRGTTPNAGSVAYWTQKWAEWGHTDPGYFFQRLSQADEFGGGGAGAGGGGGSSATGSGGTGGTATMPNVGTNVDPALRDQLLALMARSQPGAIDINSDPNLKSQSDAYNVATQRATARTRSAMAERAAAEGLNSGGAGSGAFDSGVNSLNEQQGEATANFDAGLIGQEVQAKRQDLMQALSLANSIGARDEAAQIQIQLANLDNQYRYSALSQNQGQWNDQFGLNKAMAEANARRQAVIDALPH